MKSLPLFKIVVFYLVIGLAVVLICSSFSDFYRPALFNQSESDFHLFKELFFLTTGALIIYFSVRSYQKSNETTHLNYQKLFKGCPLPMYIMTENGFRILAANEAMVKLYGYTEEEFVKLTALDIRPDSEKDRIKEFLDNYDGSRTESGTWLHLKKNGETFYVQVTLHTLALSIEDTYLVMITDIDKSVSDERKINDLIHLYETVNKATHDVIWDYDLIADRLSWMQGYDEIYGYPSDFGADSFWEMQEIHPDNRPEAIAAYRKILSNKEKDWLIEYKYICADGSLKYVRDRGFMIFDERGEPVRMIGALQDIDKQKKYEEQLLTQNRQLKEIAWLNSHTVRRPLSNIMGLISLIKDLGNKEENILQFIELLAESSKELDNAVALINLQTAGREIAEFYKDIA